ncbi:hypothetical protein FZC74_16865 [Sutcliffiella horikoshii]|uniref:DUF4367 domain-containing protein n=1 Tax=Sutcliffiella horikoshii TaxID=79883 RepID=A0AA94WNT1_9BACI|nr:hypothetical protein [Sutcliffiella horikoshii]TYS57356.1 hypothetical protein FZC74_16865 [Sutcliffiella horikoshii]
MKNNTEWLEPLKNRPDLLMDVETCERLEHELRGMKREKNRLRLWIPSVAVSVFIAIILFVGVQNFLPGDNDDGLSAEMRETLNVFHEMGEPAYYFTALPFEPEKVYATEVNLSFTRSVELKYLGKEADNEYIALNIYFDMPDGFNLGDTDYQKSFETSTGERIDYSVKQTRPDLQVIFWTQDDSTFQVMNMHDPMTDPEIKELINSMKKYE